MVTKINMKDHSYRDVSKTPVHEFDSTIVNDKVPAWMQTKAHIWMCGVSKCRDLIKEECILERSITDEAYIPEVFLEHLFEPFGWTQILSILDICVNELTPTKFCDDEGYNLVTLQMASVILELGLEGDASEEPTHEVDCKRIVDEISVVKREKQTEDEFMDSQCEDLPLLDDDLPVIEANHERSRESENERVKEKKITSKAQGKLDFSPQGELEDAYTLLFDGAYRRQSNKAAGGFVILNEEKKEVLKKGIQLHLAHSNNEAEYATLKAGLEECNSMGIRRLMVKGDALLIVRQVQGTWACKNSKLLQWLHEVKLLMKDFEAIKIQHISRQHNKEADNMANSQFEVMVGAIKFKEPLFQGQETMEDILYFLETSECPKHLERVQRHRLVRKALSYQLIGEYLYHKGKDLVPRRVPLVKKIEKILMSCHDGVCGGHFAQEITSRKILQGGFVWHSLHRDVQHWCKACKACQQTGDRKLSYGPRFPIFAYGPFKKWGIDAIGPLPRTSIDKQYILTATDYMTRRAEAASVAHITAADVSKFVLDYICSRFGTPLEILSDRGPGFRVDLLDALLENLSIKHVHSTPYYPQCNGLVEKTNGVLCKIITKHVRDRPQDWDKHLNAALWAYRTSFKVSTQFTPYHLVYGQEALLPIEVELGSLRVLARETTSSKEKLEQRILDLQRLELDREAATDYYITQANKKREQFNNKVKEKKLEEGMLVMRYDSRLDLSHSKKFLQRWEGPYVIFKKFKNGSYRPQDLSGKIHKYPINGWRLKELFQRIQPIKEERQVSLDA
ncbi:hypothetical protein L7F22_064071 [Adiantum nelumboides]|nr:hypothetical protein [Adiantum nelumboides]